MEKLKFAAFAAFIAACFGAGFYAGEGVAALSSGGVGTAEAAAESFVHIETSVNGETFERTVRGAGDGSVSVRVDGTKVFVNGDEIDPASSTADNASSIVSVSASANGESGRDGTDGADGEDGTDGRDSLPVNVSVRSDSRTVADKDPFISEIVVYVAYLFAF